MIATLVQIIFVVIIIGVCWWAIQQLLPMIPMGEPFRTIVRVLMVLILVIIVLWILWTILVASGLLSGRPFRIGGEPSRAVAALSATPTGYLPQLLK